MQSQKFVAILFVAACALSTGARAQNVYKCGNIYSQMPCPGSQVIDVTDERTLAQKNQAELSNTRDARLADAMEKARLQQEQKDLAANTPGKKPSEQPASTKTSNRASAQSVKARKKDVLPEYFVAQAPGHKKRKATASKTTPAKDLNRH